MNCASNTSSVRMDVSELRRFAAEVRLAFEREGQREGAAFEGFPKGRCGDSSEVLGRLLVDELALDCRVVYGALYTAAGAKRTHAWVEVDGLIIDVTLDQFQEHAHRRDWVIAKPSPLHEGYGEQRALPPPTGPLGGTQFNAYHAAYEAVRGQFSVQTS